MQPDAGRPASPPPGALRALLAAHRDEILALAARYGAGNVRVFGSVARGDEHADSDVDLLVDLHRRNPLGAVSGLGEELRELLGVRVDVVTAQLLRDEVAAGAGRDAVPL